MAEFNNNDNVNNSVYSRYNDGLIPGFKDDIKELDGKFAAVDVKQFFKKIIGEKISIKVPMKTLAEFDQLSVEETLSETRIDQSITLPLHTNSRFRSKEAPPKNILNNSAG